MGRAGRQDRFRWGHGAQRDGDRATFLEKPVLQSISDGVGVKSI